VSEAPREETRRRPPPRLRLLHEDAHVVAIDKPAGLPSVESEGERGRSCVSELRISHPTAQPVHRLDRDVSGVMLFALDEATRAALEEQFRKRTIEKKYLAVVSGAPRPASGTIRKPIEDLGKQARLGRGGAPAVTHYKTRERFGAASLVEIDLETGRYNQIRLHFAAIGCPLIGERKYARGRDSAVKFRRPALHAWRIAFDPPATHRRIELEAPLPQDLERLLAELRAAHR
jgi:23S rRNA pseudouridine1911/1915/1917 synthase